MTHSEQRIVSAVGGRFSENEVFRIHYTDLLISYFRSGLSPPHLVTELETLDEGKFWSYTWEAMLFRHLMSLDLEVVNSTGKTGQNGPDFGVKFGGKTIWLEAIVPSPNGVPSDYLQPPTSGIPKVVRKPDTERVLRCTSAISEKLRKLNDYKSKGIVDENECFVIAVNICRLSDWDVDGCGISQFPLSLEAVLPIGHLALPLSSNGKVDGPAQNITRDKLIKFNGSEIVTTGFLNQNLSGVSAILQGHQKHLLEVKLDLSVIHNPNSQNPLPSKLLGSRKEFVTVVGDEEIEVNDIAAVIGNG